MLSVDFSHFPVLHTERLALREYAPTDAAALFGLRSDTRVMAHIGKPLMTSEQEAVDLIARVAADRAANAGIGWVIERTATPGMIGMIGYHRLKLEHHTAEVGYLLGTDHWNKGIMTEALQAVLSYGFEQCHFHRIEAITSTGNAASRHLLEKCGFLLEGTLRENFYFNGAFQNSCLFGRLRDH